MTHTSGSQIILFDIETTGIDREVDQVCQLAAVALTRQEHENEDDVFNAYVLPTRSFHGKATEVNGFTIEKKSLRKEGKTLPTISLEKAYKTFFEYLKLKTNPGDKLMLVGYNSKQFDMVFLRRDCHKFGIPVEVEGRQLHFADAFLFLLAVRNSVLPGIGNRMTQQSVHQYLCPGIHRVCHDAVADVLNLRDILLSPKQGRIQDLRKGGSYSTLRGQEVHSAHSAEIVDHAPFKVPRPLINPHVLPHDL